jgi:hypothetical protein
MSLRWFRPDAPKTGVTLEEYLHQLEPFGVVLKPECGRATYFVDEERGDFMMEIGSLVYWPHLGRMNCFPRIGVSERKQLTLLGAASFALREDRFSKAGNWRSIRAKGGEDRGKPGWRDEILVALQPDEPAWQLIASSRESVQLEDFPEVLTDTTTTQGLLDPR